MCLQVYIGSKEKLPFAAWDETRPEFYFQEETQKEILDLLKQIFQQ